MQDEGFEPKIVAFFCNWCTYMAADATGVARKQYPANINVIRMMCSGRVDPQFVMDAFAKGADGVLIGGCHPGDCHYSSGNYKNLRRFTLLKRMLKSLGIDGKRVRLEWISASESDKLQKVVTEMTAQLREMGPLDMPGKLRNEDRELEHTA